jgi:hypothetical protein
MRTHVNAHAQEHAQRKYGLSPTLKLWLNSSNIQANNRRCNTPDTALLLKPLHTIASVLTLQLRTYLGNHLKDLKETQLSRRILFMVGKICTSTGCRLLMKMTGKNIRPTYYQQRD